MMSRARAEEIIVELHRRARQSRLLEAAFPAQRAFLDDGARLKAALCTRRAGKSYGIGLYLADEARKHDNASVLYVGLTRESAKRTMCKDVFDAIGRSCGVGWRHNATELSYTLRNGSVIYILGADASESEAKKLLGQKYRLVVVDEAQDWRTDVRDLVYSTLKPAVADYRGTICLTGTPGNHRGFFHDVTTGKEPGWSVHRWSALDNPHMAAQWQEEIRDLVAVNPRIVETPRYRQMYLGEWVTDDSARVYSGYARERNDTCEAPELDETSWVFVLGVDFGFTDATALVLGAYRRDDPTLWLLRAAKRTGLDVSATAAWIQRWCERYPVRTIVGDASARQVVEELRVRHRLPVEAAEKRGKAEAIAMMNGDLITRRVRVLQPHCAALTDEWAGLVWDERELPKRVEHPSCDNHVADAALYLWRRATNYAAVPADEQRKGPARNDAEAERDADDEAERERSKGSEPWWMR